MDHQQNPYIDHNSWMSCLGDLEQAPQIQPIQALIPTYPSCQIPIEPPYQHPIYDPHPPYQQIQHLINLHQSVDKQLFKRSHSQIELQQEFFTSNSSSSEIKNNNTLNPQPKSNYKKQKYAKQYIYSKNYRDKKKEQFKLLEEENLFLKNKIDQLQARLRDKQLEINRLKHHSLQKELTIQELNRQFLTKVSLFADKIQNIVDKQQPQQVPEQRKKVLLDQLIKTYDQHGFAGSRKKQILGYYMDQIIEVVLRDSEKYLCMLCCKNKDSKLQKQFPQYQKINNAFFEIMELTQQDHERLQKYISFIFPIMKEIKKQCSELYKNYSRILSSMDKVHQFMKFSYADNLDFVKKRMKLQSWFEYHKYHRIMRKLKEEWLELIKKQKNLDGKDGTRPKSLTKKTKLDSPDLES